MAIGQTYIDDKGRKRDLTTGAILTDGQQQSVSRPVVYRNQVGESREIADPSINPSLARDLESQGFSSGAPVVSRPITDTNTAYVAPIEEDVYARKRAQVQDEINQITRYGETLLREQEGVNLGRERATNSVSVLSGLAGSSEAALAAGKTAQTNALANSKIREEIANRIGAVLSGVRSDAAEQVRFEREQSRLDAAEQDRQRTVRATRAVESIQNMIAGGVTYEGLRTSDPSTFAYLAKQAGSEAELKGLFTKNIPVEQIEDKRVENGKYIIAYRNPVTGKVRVETLDLGIPNGFNKSVDLGDKVMFIPDKFNPETDKPFYVPKGLAPKDATNGIGGLLGISSTAQNIIDLVNKGADIDSLIKGTSKEAQALRNEVYKGLSAQGGRAANVVELLREGKYIVDDMLASRDYVKIGGWSTRLGGQFGTGFGDAMAKAQQLGAILAKDNIGILKGAMSDKDLEFIKAMSSGFEGAGIQSEAYLKNRLEAIQAKLGKKIAESAQSDEYASFRAQLTSGEVLVNRGGQAVAVTEAELLPTDERL